MKGRRPGLVTLAGIMPSGVNATAGLTHLGWPPICGCESGLVGQQPESASWLACRSASLAFPRTRDAMDREQHFLEHRSMNARDGTVHPLPAPR